MVEIDLLRIRVSDLRRVAARISGFSEVFLIYADRREETGQDEIAARLCWARRGFGPDLFLKFYFKISLTLIVVLMHILILDQPINCLNVYMLIVLYLSLLSSLGYVHNYRLELN